MSALTASMRESLAYAARAQGDWVRSRTAGERVTLAALERRGLLERQPWRGDGVSRDSAFEYRLAPAVVAELRRRKIAKVTL
jgi:hypothetical protein